VSPFYDPMIAKIIVSGQTRPDACERLTFTLNDVGVWPVKTNAAFLYKLSTMDQFLAGAVDTGLIQRRVDQLTELPPIDSDMLSWTAEQLVPTSSHFGFRLNAERRVPAFFLLDGQPTEVELRSAGNSRIKSDDAFVVRFGRTARLTNWRDDGGSQHIHHDGEIEAPMPGRVTAVEVSPGEKVAEGQRLLTLEAMKMEHGLTAPFAGTVAELAVKPGVQVAEGQLLVKVEPDA
jgi:3-methylcrotonyl-CoA carboxylase alpha subunit